jgi:hypothetical protein
MFRWFSPGAILMCAILAGCSPWATDAGQDLAVSTPTSTTAATTSTTASPTTTSTSPSTTEPLPVFEAAISPIDSTLAARMSSSWRSGCPVGLGNLRLIEVSHFTFDGQITTGELVIHEDAAQDIVGVFELLFADAFPIERMQLVDIYEADDDASMAANNTSAFNCREVAWQPGVWSNHAFGNAIDINPLVNPYVSSTQLLPPEGAMYADRSVRVVGGIYAGDPIVDAFAEIGWTWGGTWSNAKDWQHFDSR